VTPAPPDTAPSAEDQDPELREFGNANGPDLVATIGELQKQLEEAKKERLRALAEAHNTKYALSNIAKTLLLVTDTLSRLLLVAPADERASNESLKNLARGVEQTEKQLLNILEQQGVRKFDALGQQFDTMLHFAIEQEENTIVPAGTILRVLEEGYTIHDRVLRGAMVITSRGGPKREPSPAP
jgi:molecular chaperone GrpE